MTTIPTRRALLGGAGLVSVAAIAPAMALPVMTTRHSGCPIFRAALDASAEANHRFNHLPADLETSDEARYDRETNIMIAASRRADRAIPSNWQEFTRLIGHMTDDGHSSIDDDNAERLLAHARRLAAREV